MTRKEKKKLQAAFFRKAGPNAVTFKAMMGALPHVAFYMKDAEGRIMALNKRNCDICNIHDELDAVGQHSDDIFPNPLAHSYMAHDEKVRKTTVKIVSEIAAETGFWDQSHFTKIFKRERGMTPGEYRRRHRR